MKFYYAKLPHSSLPVHVVLEELGLTYESVLVDLTAEPSQELLRANPVGGVPTLVLDNGQSLTEISMILQYLGDQHPQSELVPPWGTAERYSLQEWLSFIATEIHKGFWPFGFVGQIARHSAASEDLRKLITENLEFKFDVAVKKLGSRPFLLGSKFTVADAYLFTVLIWANRVGIELDRWPTLAAFVKRIEDRPSTKKAVKLASKQN